MFCILESDERRDWREMIEKSDEDAVVWEKDKQVGVQY